MRKQIAVSAILLAGLIPAAAQPGHDPVKAPKAKPDYENVKYGPYERNVLDLWKAPSRQPAPVLIFFHGGGFRQGDKSSIPAFFIDSLREAGISVASANYRLSHQASFPAPMLDGARAIQFLRFKAKEWNLDASRIAASGGSAGAGISLWIGFHDDLADPKSSDPVSRQSTRLAAMPVYHAQSSYDPRFIKRIIGGRAHEHPALLPFFGLKPGEEDSPRAYKIYEESAPITYLTKDDPPVYLFYGEPKGPLPADAKPGDGIHHPNFGVVLKEKMDQLGIECVLRHIDDFPGKSREEIDRERVAETVRFLQKHFRLSGR